MMPSPSARRPLRDLVEFRGHDRLAARLVAGLRRTRPQVRLAPVSNREGSGHEAVEQRVRALGPALELGVELARDEPRVVLELDDLDEPAVGALTRQEQPGRLEGLA